MKRGCWCRVTDECTNSLPHKRSAVTSMQHEAESIKEQHVCKQSADLRPVLIVAAFPPTLLSVSSWTELHQVSLVDRRCCFSPAFLDSSSELCSPICCCSFRVSLRAICSPSWACHCLNFWQYTNCVGLSRFAGLMHGAAFFVPTNDAWPFLSPHSSLPFVLLQQTSYSWWTCGDN